MGGQSGLATFAGIVLLLVGVVLTVPLAVVLTIGGVMLASGSSLVVAGTGDAALVILVVVVAVLLLAAAHIAAGIGVFLQKRWARRIGMVIGAVGVFVGLVLMLTEIQATPGPRFSVPLALAVIAYGLRSLLSPDANRLPFDLRRVYRQP